MFCFSSAQIVLTSQITFAHKLKILLVTFIISNIFVKGFCIHWANMSLWKKANMKNIEACQLNNSVDVFILSIACTTKCISSII